MGTAALQMEQMKQNMKAAWMAGDFGQIAKYTEAAAAAFIERLHNCERGGFAGCGVWNGEYGDTGGARGRECDWRGHRDESSGTSACASGERRAEG